MLTKEQIASARKTLAILESDCPDMFREKRKTKSALDIAEAEKHVIALAKLANTLEGSMTPEAKLAIDAERLPAKSAIIKPSPDDVVGGWELP